MGDNVKKLEGNKVEILVEVSPEDFNEALQKAYFKTKKKYNVPKFRPGKAPQKVIEAYYGEGVFYEEAFETVFPDVYGKVIDENGLDIVSSPENIDIKKIGRQEGLVFTAEAYVKPEVKVKKYKGVEVVKREAKIGAKEVNAELERVQQQNVRWVEVDRAAKIGDTLVIDYSGSINGKKFDGGTAEGQSLELGSNMFIPGFEDQLVGAKAGDKKQVNVPFPEAYPAAELAGKDAVFDVNVVSVKEKELPEIDDDFASDVSDFDTLAEYKKDIKKNLTKREENRAKEQMENEIIEKIVDSTKIDIPQCMIDSQIDYNMQQLQYQLMYSGMKMEDYLKMTGKTMEDLRADHTDDATKAVKSRLCIEAMIKQEKIEADDKDVDALIADSADQINKTVEDYKKSLGDEDMEYFKQRVRVDKLFDMLLAEAKYTDEPVKKTAAKKTAEAKPAAEKKPAAKKATAAKKPAEKKPAAKKTTAAKKPAEKKTTAAKKPAAKKTAAKKAEDK